MGLPELMADRLGLDDDTRAPFIAEVEKLLGELRHELDGTYTLGGAESYDAQMFVLDLWAEIRAAAEEGAPVTRIVAVTMTEDADGNIADIRTSWSYCTPGDMLVAVETLRNAASERMGGV